MNIAMSKTILDTIIYKAKFPQILMGVEYAFVLDYVSKYSVSGYVVGLIGTYKSKFKQVSVQTSKSGEKYVVADRKKFRMETLQEAKMDKKVLQNELAIHKSLLSTYKEMEANGEELGYAVKNQEFFIHNIEKYLA